MTNERRKKIRFWGSAVLLGPLIPCGIALARLAFRFYEGSATERTQDWSDKIGAVSCLLIPALPLAFVLWIFVWRPRPEAGTCPHCGCNLKGVDQGDRFQCPECGRPLKKRFT